MSSPISCVYNPFGFKDQHIFVNVFIGCHSIRAVIDTGATCSFLNVIAANRLRDYTHRVPHNSTVRMADGNERLITKKVNEELRVGEREYPITLLVMRGAADDIILGMDVLVRMGMHITVARHRIEISEPSSFGIRILRCIIVKEVAKNQANNDHEEEIHTNNKEVNERQSISTPKADVQKISQVSVEGLSRFDQQKINQFLAEELPKFDLLIRPTPDLAAHRINMLDDVLLENECIELSRSPHSSPIVLVRKKTEKWSLCVDFRQINAKSIPDAYPLPRIQSILGRLWEAKFISTLDLKNGYRQVPMEESSRQYTAQNYDKQ